MSAELDGKLVPDEPLDRLLVDMKFQRFLPYVRGRVLDVGCGIGLISEMLVDRGFSVEGVDGSPARIMKARLRVPSARFTCAYFKDFAPSVQPDTIILSSVLEHDLGETPSTLLSRCFRWLGDGGVLIAAVPNRLALHKRVGRAMGLIEELSEADIYVGHTRTYDLKELIAQMVCAGFRIEGAGGVCVKPLPNQMLKNIPVEVLTGYFEASSDPELTNLCSVVYAVGEKRL